MLVRNCSHGDVIETLASNGTPTGNVYRIAEEPTFGRTMVYAWRNHRQGKTLIGTNVTCRLLSVAGAVESYSF